MENFRTCGKLVKKTYSASETVKFGEEFAAGLTDDNLFLWGELGAGKTTFLKGLGKGLGINSPVVSPTFQLVRNYRGPAGQRSLIHIDLYRLSSLQEIMHLGWDDMLESSVPAAVEWADRAKQLWPEKGIFIKFTHISPDEREIDIYREKKDIPGI